MSSKIKSSHGVEDGTPSHCDVLKIAVTSFYHSTLAKQGDVGKEPQFSIRRRGVGGVQKVGEVSLTKLRPGWRQV